jgi:hypothetical protein
VRLLPLVLSVLIGSLACAGAGSDPVPAPAPPGPPPAPTARAPGVRLEALIATSGEGVEAVLDGQEGTSWSPEGDPSEEGVLLRFDEPVGLSGVRVLGCKLTRFTVFADGDEVGSTMLADKPDEIELPSAGGVRSLFVRLNGGQGACLQELVLLDKDKRELGMEAPVRRRGQVRTSSVLTPEPAYRTAYLFDGRTHFAWVEGSAGDGVGEWIEVELKEPQDIAWLDVWNGYQRSDDHFQKNGRLKKIRVSLDGAAQELQVEDDSGVQRLDLGKVVKAKTVKLEVLEVYPGSKYKDLVVSELRFGNDAGPFTVANDALRRAEKKLREELAGHPLEAVLGRSLHSRCEYMGKLKMRADSSFVWYGGSMRGEDDSDRMYQTEEVLDGAWATKKREGAWETVELFARRHRVESSFRPYGEDQREEGESTKVSGGTLSFAHAKELGADGLRSALAELGQGTAQDRVACVGSDEDLNKLVEVDAVLVKGTALTDLLVP